MYHSASFASAIKKKWKNKWRLLILSHVTTNIISVFSFRLCIMIRPVVATGWAAELRSTKPRAEVAKAKNQSDGGRDRVVSPVVDPMAHLLMQSLAAQEGRSNLQLLNSNGPTNHQERLKVSSPAGRASKPHQLPDRSPKRDDEGQEGDLEELAQFCRSMRKAIALYPQMFS
jgi:hypothetical protein